MIQAQRVDRQAVLLGAAAATLAAACERERVADLNRSEDDLDEAGDRRDALLGVVAEVGRCAHAELELAVLEDEVAERVGRGRGCRHGLALDDNLGHAVAVGVGRVVEEELAGCVEGELTVVGGVVAVADGTAARVAIEVVI